jgi:PAS domain S-box-containing protein
VNEKIPVIFLCEPSMKYNGIELIKHGAMDYFAKTPRNIYNLPSAVDRSLREFENIQRRRMAEIKLLESESKFRKVIENINDVVWEMDTRLESFSFISGSVNRFLGYTANEFLQQKPLIVIHPKSLKQVAEAKSNVKASLRKGLPTHDIQFLIEIAFIHKDGSERWGEVRGFLVEDDNHKIIALSGIVRDITGQHKAIKELEIREAYFETLIREAPLAIVILDNQDRIKQINNHFLTLFGYTPDECIGQYVNDLIVPDDYKKEGNTFTNMAARGENINSESVRRSKTGQLIDVHILGQPIMLNDAQLGILGIYQDISQRKKMEVASRVTRIKQQFLANMSHEIRSPMTGILGMLDLLKNTALDEQQASYVDVIRKSSDGLLDIVNDILDLSKIEAGKLIIRNKDFHLRNSAQNLYSLFKVVTEKKNIGFLLEFDDQLPEYVFADENRISQIITNLLSNAVKFTSQGYVKLRYKLLKSNTYDCTISISVEDTGMGIGEEDKEKLFQIFSQLDSSDTRNFDGAGLGLSISQKLAELMGASIDVVSAPIKGSTFSLKINVRKGTSIANTPSIEEVGQNELKDCHVLLTEDKRTNQMVISLMLKEIGCKVDLASNGLEAIEKIRSYKYDVVFMDIQMPVMDGLTAVRELRKQFGPEALPLIIGLSAKAMEGDAEYHIAQGMNDYLTKPVTTEILRKCMLKWADKIKKQKLGY